MAAPEKEGTGPPSPVEIQRRIRDYWERTNVPAQLASGSPEGPLFRFTEGPPTANGNPHIGHVISRALKDVQLRYRRMLGCRIVTPMAGWDCHGLPVELEVEKRHGLRSKKEIESFGVEKFCEECRASTLEVASVWEEMSRRMGYWLDYAHPYYTMAPSYIESVWWSLRQLFDRGLLEKGFYSLPYCPRCETPLSSHEVAQGYQETTDPSIVVRIRLKAKEAANRYLLVWTTTPWTLPANLLIAAHRDLSYSVVRSSEGDEYVLADAARERYFPAGTAVVRSLHGSELSGWEYEPLFPFAGATPGRFRIVLDDMVDAKEGTGLVHIAPSFGPDDQRIGDRERVGAFDPLDSRGVFLASVPPVAGKGFKAADPILLKGLRERGLVFREETIRHIYPFCWRCATPLIYRAIDSWFVRTSRFTSELVANNAQVRWVPAHLREGRFGNFLNEAKDWALSRNRYWGTPLPVWRCPKGHFSCVGSFAELAERLGHPLPASFDPHRVTVDPLRLPCPTCGEISQREPYTIDGWYDSGCAPFAQYHYPFEPGPFVPDQPLDYIAEGLDQTRGWFYVLLVLSTALFHRLAYRVCVSNGLVLDASGRKMSKSTGNVIEPLSTLERFGGDAVRWTFLITDYTESTRATEQSIQQTAARTLGTLAHVVEFYVQNARADGLSPSFTRPTPSSLLDRWILARVEKTREQVTWSLEEFDPRAGALSLRALVDDLSTWYLRRSRPRFWSETSNRDRQEANATLSFVLLCLARLFAPYAPFTSEYVHHEVTGSGYADAKDSVHALHWPDPSEARSPALEQGMDQLRERVEIGRELRQRAQVRSRIPLAELVFGGAPPAELSQLGVAGEELLRDELNVRDLRWDPSAALASFDENGWVVRSENGHLIAALRRRPTPELVEEGLVREALRRLQQRRKELRLAYTDPISVRIYAEGPLFQALDRNHDRLARELLADRLEIHAAAPPSDAEVQRWEWDGFTLNASVEPGPVSERARGPSTPR